MFPGGMNPKQMQTALKRMGIKVEDVDAERVIIEGYDRNLIIEKPQVMLMKMPGQEVFQITGEVSEAEKGEETAEVETEVETQITDEDIAMVAEQANVDKVQAEEALLETRGDIAEAILMLRENRKDTDVADE